SAEFSIAITTVNTREQAERLAAAILEQRLAACIQIAMVDSRYVWKGAVQSQAEFQLQMKIRSSAFDALCTALRAIHPYETPEIIKVEISGGDAAYLSWMRDVTSSHPA
ncbi:MAG: divalent-cation tolerance protein CutA, partial [Alphaproteobacteria bacterium]|nr:divalent-cation tolerance protein CutA [Alphaproteobacteria bacterium]